MDDAIIAANRFGYGGGPSTRSGVGGDARNWLKAQLASPMVPASLTGLPAGAGLVVIELQIRKRRQEMKRQGDGKVQPQPGASKPEPAAQPKPDQPTPEQEAAKRIYLDEVAARYTAACDSRTPLVERLVAFWSNHFTVSGVRPVVRPVAGAFEREAIRPHILGSFADLVFAAVQHPAMGLYLDNAVSVGPNSQAGENRGRGLNENLGRELLELHTLGVDGGYTEDDVRALARILTGWSIGRLQDPDPGHFQFLDRFHEPGPKTLLGRAYPEGGMHEGIEAIMEIAHHPATARHIARKLARHFIADDPPPAAVDRLAAAFRESHGNLRAVAEALIDLPEAWQSYQKKVKTPWDLVVSASVATGIRLPGDQLAAALNRLGQAVYMAPSPAGWGDDASTWIGPEAVLRRVEWCQAFAERADQALDPMIVADYALGETLPAAARETVSFAESRPSALALVLASPAFQRR
jgi:uncharacterized protein (DUF1800 family)